MRRHIQKNPNQLPLVYSLGCQVSKHFLGRNRSYSTSTPRSWECGLCLICVSSIIAQVPGCLESREGRRRRGTWFRAWGQRWFQSAAGDTYSNLLTLCLGRGRPVWAAAAHPKAEEAPHVLPICLLPRELLSLAARERCPAPEAWRSAQ